MLEEFQFEDIVFGVFPKVGSALFLRTLSEALLNAGGKLCHLNYIVTTAAWDMVYQYSSFKGPRLYSLHENCPSCE